MGLFRRKRTGFTSDGAPVRAMSKDDLAYLEEFATSRRGVEIYVEPATTVTQTTVALVAADGEWTRRRVDGPADAMALGRRLAVPVYDVAATGYPDRMRRWTAAKRAAEKAQLRAELDGGA